MNKLRRTIKANNLSFSYLLLTSRNLSTIKLLVTVKEVIFELDIQYT